MANKTPKKKGEGEGWIIAATLGLTATLAAFIIWKGPK